jgi:hypothetical protein
LAQQLLALRRQARGLPVLARAQQVRVPEQAQRQQARAQGQAFGRKQPESQCSPVGRFE